MTEQERIDLPGADSLLRLDIFLNRRPDGNASATVVSEARSLVPKQLTQSQLVTLASKIYRSRRLRDRYLTASMLGEPAWDMLLALYCFTVRGEELSVTALCHSSGVSQTTALRWISVLEQKQFIMRINDRHDGRRKFLSLSNTAKEIMDRYLESIHADLTG